MSQLLKSVRQRFSSGARRQDEVSTVATEIETTAVVQDAANAEATAAAAEAEMESAENLSGLIEQLDEVPLDSQPMPNNDAATDDAALPLPPPPPSRRRDDLYVQTRRKQISAG